MLHLGVGHGALGTPRGVSVRVEQPPCPACAMSKQLSSRLQGLKFMQRGSAQHTQEQKSPKTSAPATPEVQEAGSQEHWVVPAHARVRTAPPKVTNTIHWDHWLTSALDEEEETKRPSRRRVFGKWDTPEERHPESEDEFASDDAYASAPSSPEPGFQKPPSASAPPSKKPDSSLLGDRRRKLAAVASQQEGLRKKPKKDKVTRLR